MPRTLAEDLLTWAFSRGHIDEMASDLVRLSPSGAGSRGASHLASAMKCDRRYSLANIHKLTTLHEPEYRLLGTLIHTRLAYHYMAQIQDPPDWYAVPMEEALLHDGGDARPDLIESSGRIIQAYKDFWRPDPWKPLRAEYEFWATIGEIDPDGVESFPGENQEVVTAKVDLYVEVNGRRWIVDHKTKRLQWNSTRLPDWNPNEFRMSWQVLLYLNIARAHAAREGEPSPAGFIIQRVTREFPFDSDRNVVPVPEEPYRLAPQSARLLIQKERELLNRIRDKKPLVPNFAACQGAFGCDFAMLCSAGPKARSGILSNFYKKRN